MSVCERCGQSFGDHSDRWTMHADSRDCITHLKSEVERLRAEVGIVVQERQAAYARIAELEALIDKSTSLRLVKKLQNERDKAQQQAAYERERSDNNILCCEQEIKELRAERDEAREAAKACFHEVVIRVPRNRSLTVGGLLKRWPWLEE